MIRSQWQEFCHGVSPLPARLASWMDHWLDCSTELVRLVELHGSPLHMHHPVTMDQNLWRLQHVSETAGVPTRVFFACKANKCDWYIDQALALGIGVDTASANELDLCLNRGMPAERLVYSAAIKETAALKTSLRIGATVVIDNADEFDALADVIRQLKPHGPGRCVTWAVRLRGFELDGHRLRSRFGVDLDRAVQCVTQWLSRNADVAVDFSLRGLHFHIDSHCALSRIAAIGQSMDLVDRLRQLGHPIEFIDIGGGFPVSLLRSGDDWRNFNERLDQQLLQQQGFGTAVAGYRGERIVADGFNCGRMAVGAGVVSSGFNAATWQPKPADEWLWQILMASAGPTNSATTIAQQFNSRDLQLHIEPGRALVDQCGLTVARVVFRKRDQDGDALIGLAMNRTHCQTTSVDFSVDPILLPTGSGSRSESSRGCFVGAYCTESEYLTPRRMVFPHGVSIGDLVVFPNTAAYQMHFMESRSHQSDLPQNIRIDT